MELSESEIDTEYTTVGGWATELMGHIPEAGETIELERFRITAIDVDEIKVEKVVIEIIPERNMDENE